MPPDQAALLHPPPAPPRLQPVSRRLRVADVALFYGERSGGIRTYLEAKAEFAARTGAFEHHLVVPGRLEGHGRPLDAVSDDGPVASAHRHEQPSLRLAASNGYRLPLGGGRLHATLRALRPDVVLLHDPYWTPRARKPRGTRDGRDRDRRAPLIRGTARGRVARTARRLHEGAATLVPARVHGGRRSDVGGRHGRRRQAEVHLAPAARARPGFGPRPGIVPGDHVLYVGRLSREKGLRELLCAAAAAREPCPLVLLGTGPAGDTPHERARQLGVGERVTFAPYLHDRDELARAYAGASCVVLPGAHETFGLAALEAAGCGAPVVTADSTPAAELLQGSVDTFRAGDAPDLLLAIERARKRRRDLGAAAKLAARHQWDAALAAELADLETLLGTR